MASIQQSMNALVGSALGAATTGTYFIKQSPGYQAKQQAKQLEAKAERLQDYSEGIDTEDLGEAYGKSRELQIEAATLDPKVMVPSHDKPNQKVTRAERAKELIQEKAEETRFERKQAQAEQSALERLETRAKILGIQPKELAHRMELIRDKDEKKVIEKGGLTI